MNRRRSTLRTWPRPVQASDAMRAGRDRWLVSYADLVTLLLACFATAYGAAYARPVAPPAEPAPDERKAEPAPPVAPVAPVLPVASPTLRDLVEPIVIVSGSGVDVVEDHRGLVISLPESATFPRASAELAEGARAILLQLAEVLGPTSAVLRIEGHTDDVPLSGGRFATNWELSTARASAVVMFLVTEGALAPQRLSAAGFGEFHPRAPNDTAENQALNRRVDVVVSYPAEGEPQ